MDSSSGGWSAQDSEREINECIAEQTRQNGIVSRSWIAQQRVLRHEHEITSRDCYAFFAMSSWNAHEVRVHFNRDKADSAQQLNLPGFEHLRAKYAIERGGDLLSAPIEECTDDELLAKADFYDREGITMQEHARELRRYVDLRRRKRTGKA